MCWFPNPMEKSSNYLERVKKLKFKQILYFFPEIVKLTVRIHVIHVVNIGTVGLAVPML